MNKVLQKVNNFAKRFYQEISEVDVLPEYDINNENSANAEYLDDKSLEELKKAQDDVMTLFSNSVDPMSNKKEKKQLNEKGNIAKKNNNKLEMNKQLQQAKENQKNNGKELDR